MTGDLSYGPGAPPETELRLLGPLAGKRVLALGVPDRSLPVVLAAQDAKVVVVDPSAEHLDAARVAAEAADVRVELHHGDLADLAFVRAETIDVAVSAQGLVGVDDLDRVFRQVHRVLRTQCALVLSLPHPAAGLAEGRSWFDRSVSDVHTALVRSRFEVDVLLEPLPAPGAQVPRTLVLRGRKLGT